MCPYVPYVFKQKYSLPCPSHDILNANLESRKTFSA